MLPGCLLHPRPHQETLQGWPLQALLLLLLSPHLLLMLVCCWQLLGLGRRLALPPPPLLQLLLLRLACRLDLFLLLQLCWA